MAERYSCSMSNRWSYVHSSASELRVLKTLQPAGAWGLGDSIADIGTMWWRLKPVRCARGPSPSPSTRSQPFDKCMDGDPRVLRLQTTKEETSGVIGQCSIVWGLPRAATFSSCTKCCGATIWNRTIPQRIYSVGLEDTQGNPAPTPRSLVIAPPSSSPRPSSPKER